MKKNFLCIGALAAALTFFPVTSNAEVLTGSKPSDLYKEKVDAVEVFNDSSDKELYITDDDVYLMSQVVYAESGAEPFDGKVAVASVILNRMKNPQFPHTVKEVVTQKGAFSCINDGKINVTPDQDSYAAVLEALKGNDPTSKAVFFYNPITSTSKWMIDIPKKGAKQIGHHVFFKAD